jgi:NADH:ubiquinone oxidoreductase subunit E
MTPAENNPVEIVVCLGSSCFARGNSENLGILKKFVQAHKGASLHLTGSLCQDRCKQGPNLMIAGRIYHEVNAARLRELLDRLQTVARSDDHGNA